MKRSHIVLFIALGVGCIAAKLCLESNSARWQKETPDFSPTAAGFHGASLRQYSFGFESMMAGLIWINLLQTVSDSPLEKGKVSWEYAQIDAISALDPNFERAYPFGAIILSVFRRDNLGAKLILEKWIKRRPNYWRAHYLLAYHLFYEMDRFDEASEYMLKAAAMDRAPPWLHSLGVRLLSETGSLTQALKLSVDLYGFYPNPEARQRLKLRIRSLNYQIQKLVWQEALEEFRQEHKREPRGLENLRPLAIRQFRELASIGVARQSEGEIREALNEVFDFYYDSKTRLVVPVLSPEILGIDVTGIHQKKEGS